MTPIEALAQAVREARRFEYRFSDQWNEWEGRTAMEAAGHGVCRDFAAWAIERAYELCPGNYRLVIGDARFPVTVGDIRTVSSGRHAWCAITEEAAARSRDLWWADATPGWGLDVTRPEAWDRTALVGSDYDGVIFCDEWEYEK